MDTRDIIARTRRFAHLIVSSADEADNCLFDVLEQEQGSLQSGADTQRLHVTLYRSLCDRLAGKEGEPDTVHDPLPVIRRFYSLPVINRMAFALIVIEEFPSDDAADILRLPHQALEEKIYQSRRLLFEE